MPFAPLAQTIDPPLAYVARMTGKRDRPGHPVVLIDRLHWRRPGESLHGDEGARAAGSPGPSATRCIGVPMEETGAPADVDTVSDDLEAAP